MLIIRCKSLFLAKYDAKIRYYSELGFSFFVKKCFHLLISAFWLHLMWINETNDKVKKVFLYHNNKFLSFHAIVSGKIYNFASN